MHELSVLVHRRHSMPGGELDDPLALGAEVDRWQHDEARGARTGHHVEGAFELDRAVGPEHVDREAGGLGSNLSSTLTG